MKNLQILDQIDQTSKKTREMQNLESENETLRYQIKLLEEKILFYDKEYQIKVDYLINYLQKYSYMDKDQINRKDLIGSLQMKCEKLQLQLNSVLESYAIQGDQLSALEKRNLKLEDEYTRYTEIVAILNQQKSELQMMFLKLKERTENKKRKFKLITHELREARNKIRFFESDTKLQKRDQIISQNDLKSDQNENLQQTQQEIELLIRSLDQLTDIEQLKFQFQSPLARKLTEIFRRFVQKILKKQEQKRKWKNLYKENLKLLDSSRQGQTIRIKQQEQPQLKLNSTARFNSSSETIEVLQFNKIKGIKKMLGQFLEEFIHQTQFIKETDNEIGSLNKENNQYTKSSQRIRRLFKSYGIIVISILRMSKKQFGIKQKLKKLKITLPVLKNLNPLLNFIGVLSQQTLNGKGKQKGCQKCLKQIDSIEVEQIKQLVARELQQEIIQFSSELNVYKETIKQNQLHYQEELSLKMQEIQYLTQINKKQNENINSLKEQLIQLNNDSEKSKTHLRNDDKITLYENLYQQQEYKIKEIERKFQNFMEELELFEKSV